ncbi:MAG: FAD-binding protein [Alphaproteobacteria bacterium]|nr:FAD-binding protein [Alphaproteobacteria bacterium]
MQTGRRTVAGPLAGERRAGARVGDPRLAARLRGEIEGEVLFDPFERGRYATDASIYQIEPVGVVRPRSVADVEAAMTIAREEGVPVLPRGGGTSQAGQTVGEALVLDCSAHLDRILGIDVENRRARVEPGVVLGRLNAKLRRHGLMFPVDISTASRATLGGMAANNSCGSRSIRYGNMVHNTHAIEAILADGSRHRFARVPGNLGSGGGTPGYIDLVRKVRAIAERERDAIARGFPDVLRKVGGYNLESVDAAGHNMAHLLVGSEGTLGFFTAIEVDLQPIRPHKVLGVCHFPRFRDAMDAVPRLVALGPDAIELVDRTIIELGRNIQMFRETVSEVVQGRPDALLLVEFAGEDRAALLSRLEALDDAMSDLGHPGATVRAVDPALQARIWGVREAGLNIVMSMKTEGKPVSFIEDCAVPLEDLGDFTDRLTRVFEKHGTTGTWYAHASVGLLHVRPVLNLKQPRGAAVMRAIAEEAFAMVREYKGSHSGEHGDGIIRSEFHERMFGPSLVRAFEEVKDAFDPGGLFNPGKIVRAPRMDDRSLFRFKPGYAAAPLKPALDWSDWPGGFLGAAEMCNNNGACRKADPGVMCPSFRATGRERDLTRGRANTLRLALSGQLGPDALVSDDMARTMELCVGCKGCRRECPTGVDMARMKVEFLHHYKTRRGLTLRDRLVSSLPRYAAWLAPLAPLLNAAERARPLRELRERVTGFSRHRRLPAWRRDRFHPADGGEPANGERQALLFADCFNTAFEPENARAAVAVLEAAGFRVRHPRGPGGSRPPCCGRSWLAAGRIDRARAEMRRSLAMLLPHAEAGTPIVGLEPSCLFTFRDELLAVLPGPESARVAESVTMLESLVSEGEAADRLASRLRALPEGRALVHAHCHRKSFDGPDAVLAALSLVPGLEAALVESSCCGMAGSFGYEAEHYEVSMKMAEAALLPAVRAGGPDTLIAADGTSCRHQIADGAGRQAEHPARILERALA